MTNDDERDDGKDAERLPRGLVEGPGSLEAELGTTPDFMMDCLRENYVERLGRGDYHTAATRIAFDLKRRSFPKDKALEIILAHITGRLQLSREHLGRVEKAVAWVYEGADRPLSCNGALVHEGLCFKSERTCRFDRANNELRADRLAQTPNALPTEWNEFFERVHPTEIWFARLTYGELVRQETRLKCVPGDPRTPIYVGFRAIADAVRARDPRQSFTKGHAVRAMHRLIEVGLVRKVVQGVSGPRSRKANGYVRVVPVPVPPTAEDGAPGGPLVQAPLPNGVDGGAHPPPAPGGRADPGTSTDATAPDAGTDRDVQDGERA